jgi:hypothetical protein
MCCRVYLVMKDVELQFFAKSIVCFVLFCFVLFCFVCFALICFFFVCLFVGLVVYIILFVV